MRFTLPNAVPAIDNADIAINGEEHSRDLIGDEAIDKAVGETIPAYEKVLGFTLATPAQERHSRLGGLAFGKIDKDVAKLKGLAAAIENISLVVKDGKALLAQDWKGESYDAFRLNIERLEKTLDDYVAAVKTTAAGLETAMSSIRDAYLRYRDDCLDPHFTWHRVSKPGDWWKMSGDSGRYLADHCVSTHIGGCYYSFPGISTIIQDRLTTNHLFNDVLEKWDCTDDMDVVVNQYAFIVGAADEEREAIHGRINAYCDEADNLREFVGEAYAASLDNLRILAEANVFSHLSVPGATGAGDPGQGGDPGTGDDPGGGSPEAAMPPPQPDPEPAPVEPAAAQPPPDESVQIKDGDRTISVNSPDGEGHVKVTVDDGSGRPKTYDLDFDAASGLPQRPAEDQPATAPNAEHVPAGTNGKCVIVDGDLTITAERSLFDQDTIKVTVANGTDKPTTYTLDFTDDHSSGTPSPHPSDDVPAAEPPASATPEPTADPPAHEPSDADGSPVAGPVADGAVARPPAEQPASESAAADEPAPTPPADEPSEPPTGEPGPATAEASPGDPSTDVSDPPANAQPATEPPAGEQPADQPTTGEPPADQPTTGEPPADQAIAEPSTSESTATGADLPVGGSGAGDPQADGPGAGEPPADEATGEMTAADESAAGDVATSQVPVAETPGVSEALSGDADTSEPAAGTGSAAPDAASEAASADAPPAPAPVDGRPEATSAQASAGDQSGSVSGVLVPDQPTGEAELASADDGDAAGAAGAGMPMMAGAGAGGAAEGGRAGTGWSVHGDLFDNGDPVYSMHGVLGEDDLDNE